MQENLNVIITNDVIAKKLEEIYKRLKINTVIFPSCTGYSQKGNLMEFLGFVEKKSDIFIFRCTEAKRKTILKYILMHYDTKNNGIMFTINFKKGVKKVKEEKRLMVCIVKTGFGENVATSLRKLACGSTIIKGRGAGIDYNSFMGMQIDAEKEIVLSVMPATTYTKAKKQIKEDMTGIDTEVVCFSLHVSNFDKLHRVPRITR